ncbi:uncharacterized protein LOC134182348 [Corticium candelabrum]|uniref:uncharacterized protein LOC134182348 n=1 Tax=Corticium candelabrum TaxID=121492 RepID=UPI002E26D4D4|nr:uncharacterized protein LOC134182348 [Corticium candelabrum]
MSGLFFNKDSATSAGRQPFKVIIHKGELAQVEQWVRQHKQIETGGDLFGFWSTDNTAVVQLVLGPGEGSRRSVVSFYQDTQHLANCGKVFTNEYGLCHIGEWHSHHSLGLAHPSRGDQETVWSNMPKYGFKRFIIFIANIDRERSSISSTTPCVPVGLGCFLFEVKDTETWQHYPLMQGSFEIVHCLSPYRQLPQLSQIMADGAETINEINLDITIERKRSRTKGTNEGIVLMYRIPENRVYETHPLPERSPYLRGELNRPHYGHVPPLEEKGLQSATVTIDSLEPGQIINMWKRQLTPDQQAFFQHLGEELNGQLAREINAVTIQFVVKVPNLCDVACRLVCPEEQIDVLRLYIAGSMKDSYDFKIGKVFLEPNSWVQLVLQTVKEQVYRAVTQLLSRPGEASAHNVPVDMDYVSQQNLDQGQQT